MDDPRVALVHDWLPVIGGAERVVEEMLAPYPGATVYTLFDFLTDAQRRSVVGDRPVLASGLNRLPGVRRYYNYLLPWCTRAVEQFDMRPFDLVLTSSAALAKGVITGPDQLHIAYVHSPARYAWDLMHDYLGALGGVTGPLKRALARRMLHRFRLWDLRTANGVDRFVANSAFIARRIRKVYRREATVVHPPVDTSAFRPGATATGAFVTAARHVQYKRLDLVIQAFNRRPDLQLRVLGEGPDTPALRKLAGPNVTLTGSIPREEVAREFAAARGFVFAALEDFGIAPVEAQAAGTPVIALGQGGTAETVIPLGQPGATGVLFPAQTVDALLVAISRFEEAEAELTEAHCTTHAERFSNARFRAEMAQVTADAWTDFHR